MTEENVLVASVPLPQELQPPHGIEQILTTFGDIYEYIRKDGSLDPRWQADFLGRVDLPFPVTLSWDKSKEISQIICHKRLIPVFAQLFQTIHSQNMQAKIATFGGCFSFRQQRTGSRLSTHAWGIAIDLNPETNVQGTSGNMDQDLIEIFKDAGFEWGGEWAGKKKDPMHFQFCTGY